MGEMVGYVEQYIFNGENRQFYLMHSKNPINSMADNKSSRITEDRISEVLLYMYMYM